MLFALLRWWYGPGWLLAFRRIGERTHNVMHAFSVPILLKTLFAPWKRIMTTGGKGIDAKIQAALDNLVSRTVGFVTRLIVLFTALIMTSGAFIMGVAIVAVWPFIPLVAVYCLARTFL